MGSTLIRRCLVAASLSVALVVVAACSGKSALGSLSPTAASPTTLSSTGTDFSTNPNPGPCEESSPGFRTNPTDPPPPTIIGCGRFTGGGFSVGDVRVSQGFTLHCDALLSNNFEVNWPEGNNFHIDKNPTDVVCQLIDDPDPPNAPVNRIDINGTGTLNGAPATVTLVLIDNGERAGAPLDQVYIAINGVAITGGSVASPVPLDGGNIQAHFDQPHKQ